MSVFAGIAIQESRFCARDKILIVKDGVIVPELTVYRLSHRGRLPFECRFSLGESERRRDARRQAA